ncbi:MAG TPA: OsmC family protein [Candidatus Limnocylindrales bacterium]|nr:OsmC family protein [Candidatus Limnocylindrales bacterium]
MGETTVRDAVLGATAYLTEHPDEARYRDSHARARLGSGLHVEVDGPGGEQLTTDMPKGIGGSAHTPSPGWFFRAATASCVASLIGIRAAALDLALGEVEVTVDSESDDRGILGIDSGVAAGALSMRVVVSITARGFDRATIQALAHWAVDHCPVADSVRRAIPLEVVIA